MNKRTKYYASQSYNIFWIDTVVIKIHTVRNFYIVYCPNNKNKNDAREYRVKIKYKETALHRHSISK